MIEFIKDYAKTLYINYKKHPLLLVLTLWIIVVIPITITNYLTPFDYLELNNGKYSNFPESMYIQIQGLINLLSAIIIFVLAEEFSFRYWLNRDIRTDLGSKILFGSFLVTTILSIPYLIRNFIDPNSVPPYDPANGFGSIDGVINGLVMILLTLVFSIIGFWLINIVNLIISKIPSKNKSKFSVWELVQKHNKSMYFVSTFVFVFAHDPISVLLNYGFFIFVISILARLVFPFVYYNYNFMITVLIHILWNYSTFYKIFVNVTVSELIFYNITYWSIFGILVYLIIKEIKKFNALKINNQNQLSTL
jgi:Type II CAAX prenyl endopeptidase Rce1-like